MSALVLPRLSALASHLNRSMSHSSVPVFQKSPIPPNPLGEGKKIKTAGALIIG